MNRACFIKNFQVLLKHAEREEKDANEKGNVEYDNHQSQNLEHIAQIQGKLDATVIQKHIIAVQRVFFNLFLHFLFELVLHFDHDLSHAESFQSLDDSVQFDEIEKSGFFELVNQKTVERYHHD